VQLDYLEYSHSFDHGELSDELADNVKSILLNSSTPDLGKKKALCILAHGGCPKAFEILREYSLNSEGELKQWALMALEECRFFLESDLDDEEDYILIQTPMGGVGNKLWFYIMLLPLENALFQ
jgi:hypothetical protein